MLTEEEKQVTGAEYEIIYRVAVGGVFEAITVVLLFSNDFTPLARGIAICSPLDISTHQKGYRQIAKGRAVAAIEEFIQTKSPRNNSAIKPELRKLGHPVWIAYRIGHSKSESFPTLTDQEHLLLKHLKENLQRKSSKVPLQKLVFERTSKVNV